jgi:hypothetical protein
MKTDNIDSKRIEPLTRRLFDYVYPDMSHGIRAMSCFRWAVCCLTAIQYLYPEVRCVLNSGSAVWRHAFDDTGEGDYHFGYEIDRPRAASINKAMKAGLPYEDQFNGFEWHVWVVVPSTDTIIDATACFQYEQYRSNVRLVQTNGKSGVWEEAWKLPSIILGRLDELSDKSWIYTADYNATEVANMLMLAEIRGNFRAIRNFFLNLQQ